MEWLFSTVGWNKTVAIEVVSSFTSLASDSAYSWLNVALSSFLFSTEQFIKYTFNGDYQAVQQLTVDKVNSTLQWLDFTPFQVKLLREFSLILAGNTLFVIIAWKIYGERIKNKFIKTQSRTSVEELRTSISEFKLPKEMDFKFK